MEKIINRYSILVVLTLGAFLYALSFAAYYNEWLHWIALAVLIGGTIWLSWKNLWYGLLVIAAELILGSLAGGLFAVSVGGVFLGARKVIWLLILIIWLIKGIKKKNLIPTALKTSPLKWGIAALLLSLVIGAVVAVVNGVPLSVLYHDSNAYWFYLLLLPILWSLENEPIDNVKKEELLYYFSTQAIVVVIFLTLVILAVFTHLEGYTEQMYSWFRDFRIGEVGRLGGTSFYRVFIQSQILLLPALFISLAMALKKYWTRNWFWFLALVWAVLITSLSRSFAVGIIGAGVLFVIWVFVSKDSGQKISRLAKRGLASVFVGLIILAMITTLGLDVLGILGVRSSFNTEEPALRSRWDLWPAMTAEIKKSPLVGYGFGKEIIYKSSDPRLIEQGIEEYTTYSFEWGYLDIVLKMGFAGLLLMLFFYGQVLWHGWKWSTGNAYRIGWWFGLVALFITHFFTPYLNHPLGIGMIVFFAGFVMTLDNKKTLLDVS